MCKARKPKSGTSVRTHEHDEAHAHVQAGDIFPSMSNYKRGHRATSIGTQLLSNYRKYLAAYERAWAAADLPKHPLLPVSACGYTREPTICMCRSPRMPYDETNFVAYNGRHKPQSSHACCLQK
jgi:hypothetical protein